MSSSIIARMNDRFRNTFTGGDIFLTPGILALSEEAQADIIAEVQNFEIFSDGNDPYGEHDFGSFDHYEADKVFWKIDYYDRDKKMGSENPCDPSKTCRVLTILLAEEY